MFGHRVHLRGQIRRPLMILGSGLMGVYRRRPGVCAVGEDTKPGEGQLSMRTARLTHACSHGRRLGGGRDAPHARALMKSAPGGAIEDYAKPRHLATEVQLTTLHRSAFA